MRKPPLPPPSAENDPPPSPRKHPQDAAAARALARYDPTKGEAGFQRAVIELAEMCGWRVYHVSNVKGRLVNATAVGFPDLVLAHREHGVIFAELKTDRGDTSDAQIGWMCVLLKAGQEHHFWRPSDWPEIERTIARRR